MKFKECTPYFPTPNTHHPHPTLKPLTFPNKQFTSRRENNPFSCLVCIVKDNVIDMYTQKTLKGQVCKPTRGGLTKGKKDHSFLILGDYGKKKKKKKTTQDMLVGSVGGTPKTAHPLPERGHGRMPPCRLPFIE